jgi:hypothetical protein
MIIAAFIAFNAICTTIVLSNPESPSETVDEIEVVEIVKPIPKSKGKTK